MAQTKVTHNIENTQISLDAAEIPGIDASKIISGDIAAARLSLATETKPTVSSVSPSLITNDATNITITGTDFTAIPRVDIINTATGIWYSANTVTHNSATSLTVNVTLPVDAGTYRIRVENPDGLAGLSSANFLTVSDAPVWTTSAGSLGTVAGNTNGAVATVAATGDSITYSEVTNVLTNASLANCSLNSSTGAITSTDFDGSSTSARTHTFTLRATDAQGQTSDREFTLTSSYFVGTGVTYLVVGGGGSGGYQSTGTHATGGGGAGGYLTNYGGTAISLNSGTTYSITVGAGGVGGTDSNNGANSVLSGSGITTVTAIGGGRGGRADGGNGNSGGSGGGGASGSGTSGGAGTSGQGNSGGSGAVYGGQYYNAGGGGGAGASGGNTPQANISGSGGAGLSNSITGTAVTYAGGGGGAARDATGNTSYSGNGGAGGGGKGGDELGNRTGIDGTDGLGGGGGGQHTFGGTAGHGGDGVVIVRLLTSDYTASTITGTHTTTTIGSETAIKWSTNGTLVTP
jgi:hypothetical protein